MNFLPAVQGQCVPISAAIWVTMASLSILAFTSPFK